LSWLTMLDKMPSYHCNGLGQPSLVACLIHQSRGRWLITSQNQIRRNITRKLTNSIAWLKILCSMENCGP